VAPKNKFTKQDIVQAAFDIAKVEGIDALTIRRIAKQIGSSIAPIYVNFKNIEEVKEAVVKQAQTVAKELILEQKSGQPFRDIGIASLKFAREYSVLYRDLIMKNNEHMKHNKESVAFAVQQMKQDPILADFTDETLRSIILKMEIFQTGLCVMAANHLLPMSFKEEQMIEMLDRAAEDIITAEQVRGK